METELKSGKSTSPMAIILSLVGVVVSGFFLANLSFGLIEIPDNMPLVGNLDEVFFSAVFFTCLSHLGINVLPMKRQAPRTSAALSRLPPPEPSSTAE
jgi:hypothetical protein